MKTKKTFRLGNGLFMKFDPKSPQVTFKFGKSSVKIDRKELWYIVFTISDAEWQDSMLPVRKTEMMQFLRQHQIQLKKDMKEGEILKFHCKVNVPETVVAGLKELAEGSVIDPFAEPALT